MREGSCKFGLWRIVVAYSGTEIYRVRFVRSAPEGPVPVPFTRYISGRAETFEPLTSVATEDTGMYAAIYKAVQQVPYGETRTYGEIADICSTHARVVGTALARNPTPLIVPCHRIVASNGLGGFSPDLTLKRDLLNLEIRTRKKNREINKRVYYP